MTEKSKVTKDRLDICMYSQNTRVIEFLFDTPFNSWESNSFTNKSQYTNRSGTTLMSAKRDSLVKDIGLYFRGIAS